MKNIAVFFGGESVEHDISVITGVMTLNSLDKDKFKAIPVYIDNDGIWYTGEILKNIESYKNLKYKNLIRITLLNGDNKIYSVKGSKMKPLLSIYAGINCLHGERGEDGSLAGLLNMCAIPLCSPPIMASSVSMDKAFTKTVMRGLGIKTLPAVTVDSVLKVDKALKRFSFPLIVKPCTSGSSMGILKAEDEESLKYAVSNALRFSDRAVIEPFIKDFTEINCASFRGADGKVYVSDCERPEKKSDILSFKDKYQDGVREFPALISKRLSDRIKKTTEKIYTSLFFSGIIRIDYMIIENKVFVNEINSVPGSLAFYLFCDTMKDFSVLLTGVIEDCAKKFSVNSTLQKKFSSGLLDIKGVKGAKRL